MSSSKVAIEIWKSMVESKRFDRVLRKIKIISAHDGKCTAEMTVEEEHTNRNGTLHGGYTATIVDMITSMALVTNKQAIAGVSVDMHISYLKSASLGDQILIEAKTNKVGRTLAFLDVVIKKKESGDLVATGSHTKFVGS
ncbi:acyl-coenzyme A thioesterase 13-like [Lycorma delicatula]|uniref:acyl-coenzyme A thioesterase 13-like n=1 Tax=Lycorma delicatula TaxID=130591 RepID=UPI003F50EE67